MFYLQHASSIHILLTFVGIINVFLVLSILTFLMLHQLLHLPSYSRNCISPPAFMCISIFELKGSWKYNCFFMPPVFYTIFERFLVVFGRDWKHWRYTSQDLGQSQLKFWLQRCGWVSVNATVVLWCGVLCESGCTLVCTNYLEHATSLRDEKNHAPFFCQLSW